MMYFKILPLETSLKILFFTRIENNTGGDEAFLLMISSSLMKRFPPGSEVNLVLSHDTSSTVRAQGIKERWESTSTANGHRAVVFLNNRATTSGYTRFDLDCNEENMSPNDWSSLTRFIQGDEATGFNKELNFLTSSLGVGSSGEVRRKKEPLDLFIISGWANQLVAREALYMQKKLHIPENANVLLFSSPGKEINKDFLKALKREYPNTQCCQSGLKDGDVGLFLSSTLSRREMESSVCREKWLSHINGVSEGFKLDGFGREQQDKLIVIYCSKERPLPSAVLFMNNIKNQVGANNIGEYPVLLIGVAQNSAQYTLWTTFLHKFGVQSIHALNRTSAPEVLMRGLRDAQFSMTTGVSSIIEAKRLEINHSVIYVLPI